MSKSKDTIDKAAEKLGGDKFGDRQGWVGAAAVAAGAVGSAALAGALLYASRRKKADPAPKRPHEAPETD